MKPAPEPNSARPKPLFPLENATGILPVRRSRLALVEKHMAVVRNQLSSQKPPGSLLSFSRTRVQHFVGSSTIELPSILAESGGYSPSSTCSNTVVPAAAPIRLSAPEGHRAALGETVQTQPSCHRVSTNRLRRVYSQLVSLLEGESGLTPAGTPPPPPPKSYPKSRFRVERAGGKKYVDTQFFFRGIFEVESLVKIFCLLLSSLVVSVAGEM